MSDREITERDLSFAERTIWGRCPVCAAEHGSACDPEIGFHMADEVQEMQSSTVIVGAHLGRLQNAPFTVIIAR